MSPAPDAAARAAAENLQIIRRKREIEQELLARSPESQIEPTLDRVRAVMELLGDPAHAFPVVHITGTNGKTSTARMIERLLRECGLSTGRLTSPHLHDISERIALNGKPIDVRRFVQAYEDVLPNALLVDARSAEHGGPPLTYFEVMVVLGYAAFADAPVDVAVVEVGLGGSWDATNVADGTVAVITPIALDHQQYLGDSIEQIATEKAGIIKDGALAVVGAQQPEAAEVLLERIEEVGARAAFEGNDFGVTERSVALGGQLVSVRGLAGDYRDVLVPLHGEHQAHNAAVALAAAEAFLGGGQKRLDLDLVREAFAGVTSPGRLEMVRRSPTVLVDAAHNPAGASALRDALSDSFTFTRLVGVLAVLKDKDAEQILQILEPVLDHVVLTRTTSPRATPPEVLGRMARDIYGEDRVSVIAELPDALDQAAALAEEAGLGGGVLATGSVVTAGEVRMLLGVTET